jgi:aryl-alcohol dehydrogenase-like predicted oxidoreductase
VDDIRKFVQAGVTTLDTADHYGASENYIGRFLAGCSEEERARVQVRCAPPAGWLAGWLGVGGRTAGSAAQHAREAACCSPGGHRVIIP